MGTRVNRCALQRQLDRIAAAAFRAECKAIAAARAKYVVPFCDRTGYSLCAGMGGWSFHKGDKSISGWGRGEPTPGARLRCHDRGNAQQEPRRGKPNARLQPKGDPVTRPHYRLRVAVLTAYRAQPALTWQVQHVAGCRKDHLAYASSWYASDSGAAVNVAAAIPQPIVTVSR
jgi:hypothetical protein